MALSKRLKKTLVELVAVIALCCILAWGESAVRSHLKENEIQNEQILKPFMGYWGQEVVGENYVEVAVKGEEDCIVIVRSHSFDKYINHMFVKKGKKEKMMIPNGLYDIYFYLGSNWNSSMTNGAVRGGFEKNEQFLKETNLDIQTAFAAYEFPKDMSSLETSDREEIFGEKQ